VERVVGRQPAVPHAGLRADPPPPDADRDEGGTTFHFVTDGIHAALAHAQQAAGGRDVRLGGGVATIRQYLREGLVDEMHLAMAPVLLGAGEALFPGIDLPGLGYQCTEHVSTPNATHVVLTNRRARSP